MSALLDVFMAGMKGEGAVREVGPGVFLVDRSAEDKAAAKTSMSAAFVRMQGDGQVAASPPASGIDLAADMRQRSTGLAASDRSAGARQTPASPTASTRVDLVADMKRRVGIAEAK